MLHPRLRLVLIGLTACAIAAVAGVWVAESRDEPAFERAAGFEGATRPDGARAADLSGLRDAEGRRGPDIGGLLGRPAVMTFIYSTCEDTCPTQVQSIRGALDRLGRDVPVYGVSVDPENDTPERARRFVLEQRMTGRMRFLLGARGDLRRVWDTFGIAPQREDLDHSAYVVIVDGDGRQRIGFPVGELTPERLEHDLRALGA